MLVISQENWQAIPCKISIKIKNKFSILIFINDQR